ncbi:MAG: 3-isopropylmalate dehydratase [Lachnospiraceae bacterium]|nr:3-isopropylmalate dehydratase [Lachnospiraceae bacterium]
MQISAKAIVYGDDINTDLIIAGKYTKTLNTNDLVEHCMEDLDPDFHQKCADGAIIVAGKYFGCGSSREQAPIALKNSGVKCVVAKSFSRIFYRSAINIGLPLIECNTELIEDGDLLECELGGNILKDINRNLTLHIHPLPELMRNILECGGMVEVMKRYGGFEEFIREVKKRNG